MRCVFIDQQGGKGNCASAMDVCGTICSDSHGTPHAVAIVHARRRTHTMKPEQEKKHFHSEVCSASKHWVVESSAVGRKDIFQTRR